MLLFFIVPLAIFNWQCSWFMSASSNPIVEDSELQGRVVKAGTTIPIESALVTIQAEGLSDTHTTTGSDGSFIFIDLPEKFNLRIEKEGFDTYDHYVRKGVLLDVNKNDKRPFINRRGHLGDIDLEFTPTVIRGTVYAKDSDEPIQGARITASPSVDTQTETDSLGRYELRSSKFESGFNYMISVNHNDYLTNNKTLPKEEMKLKNVNELGKIELEPRQPDEIIKAGEPHHGDGPGTPVPSDGKNE